jgi:tetratricopeptide (TPR) repeat protein
MRPFGERAVRRLHPMLGQRAQKNLPLGRSAAEEDFGDCRHRGSFLPWKGPADPRLPPPASHATTASMVDFVPARVWLLLLIGLVAFVPLQYIVQYVTHSPNRRDITQQPADLGWRTTGRLVRNLALLAIAGGLAVFIFTPTAARVAHATWFWPSVALGVAAFVAYSIADSLLKGRVEPLIRGFDETYRRELQPKRFWTFLAVHAVIAAGLSWFASVELSVSPEERCFEPAAADEGQSRVDACDKLLAKAGTAKERGHILAYRAIAYHWLADYRRALLDYSQAIELDPKDAFSLFNRAQIYAYQGDLGHALTDYDRVLKLDPAAGNAHFNRGLIFLDIGQFDRAIDDFTQAHALDPDDVWPLANRGLAYAWKKDRARAELDFGKAAQVEPSNKVLLHGQAVIEFQEHHWQAAVDRLSEAVRRYPDDAWALSKRADAYWELREWDKARDDDDRVTALHADTRIVAAASPGSFTTR